MQIYIIYIIRKSNFLLWLIPEARSIHVHVEGLVKIYLCVHVYMYSYKDANRHFSLTGMSVHILHVCTHLLYMWQVDLIESGNLFLFIQVY